MLNKEFRNSYDVIAEQKRHPRKFALARAVGRPFYLRHHRQPGWKGDLPIYVRWCGECEIFSISHPQGYAERIHCTRCRKTQQVMTWTRFRSDLLPVIVQVIVPALIICGAYAIFRLWWVTRG